MTGKEICEAYARFKGVPEDAVVQWAKQFWEQSPTGELVHVYAALEEMRAAGVLNLGPLEPE